MKLVEVIRGAKTSDETYSTIAALASELGKEPVEVNEAPGFVVNKILIPLVNEGIDLVYTGVASVEGVDKAMKLGANHPMGPLELGDLIGLDVCLAIMDVLYQETVSYTHLGGDEALGEAGIPTSMDQLFPQHLAHGVQAVFDPQSLSQDGAQHHAHDDTQGVLRPHGGGDADTQDAQAQGVGEDGVKTRPDMVLEEHAQQAAQQDESGVDECGRHEKDSFPSTENVVLRYHTTGTLPL